MESATTLAPSFEELPLEKGSILELHSIGKGWDGVLVEYEKTDKSTGKFLVSSLKDEQNMFVKPKTCRRPAIKPLKLRSTLTNLVLAYVRSYGGFASMTQDSAGIEAKVKGFIEKDPCCVPAYLLLGSVLDGAIGKAHGVLRGNGDVTRSIHNLRLGLANLYAYKGLVPEDMVHCSKSLLSDALVNLGRPKAATRVTKYTAGGQERVSRMSLYSDHTDGITLVGYAQELRKQQRYEREFEDLSSANERFLKCLEVAANTETLDWKGKDNALLDSCLTGSIDIMLQYYNEWCDMRASFLVAVGKADDLDAEILQRVKPINLVTFTSDCKFLCERVLHLVNDVYSACTAPDGTIMFMDSSQKDKLRQIKDACLKHLSFVNEEEK